MTYDPQFFLKLATSLYIDNNYDNETRFRTSISRAYYAAHLFSRKKLELKGCNISKEGTAHQEVINLLKKENPHIGYMLLNLKRKRKEADYNLNLKFNEYQTKIIIEEAEIIIDEVNNLK